MYLIIKHLRQVQPVLFVHRDRPVNTVGLNNILFIQHNHKLNK